MPLMKWATADATVRGLYPHGLDDTDFIGSVDNELIASFIVGDYDGLKGAPGNFSMTPYDPETDGPFDLRRIIVIDSVTSTDPAFMWDDTTNTACVKQGETLTVTGHVDNYNPAPEDWLLPLRRNGEFEAFLSVRADAQGLLAFDFALSPSGLWAVREDDMNAELPPGELGFSFPLGFTAKVSL